MEDFQRKQIDLSNYEVVRQDYGTGQEPQLTLGRGRIYINSYGLSMFPEHDYMQILVDKNSKCMVLKPSKTKVKDSFRWCTSGKKRKPRQMKCIPLYYLTYQLMGWDLSARYRITGDKEVSEDNEVLVFRLMDAISYVREITTDENGKEISNRWEPVC